MPDFAMTQEFLGMLLGPNETSATYQVFDDRNELRENLKITLGLKLPKELCEKLPKDLQDISPKKGDSGKKSRKSWGKRFRKDYRKSLTNSFRKSYGGDTESNSRRSCVW